MTRDRDTSRRWFRRLLRLLPFAWQRNFGDEMEQSFLAEEDEASARSAADARRVRRETVAGLLRVAPREHVVEVMADLRHAWRQWRATPLLAATLVGSLAGGIAVLTVAFAVVDGIVLRPLPLPEPQALVRLQERHPDRPTLANLTYATFLDLEDGGTTFSRVAASRFWFANLTGDGEAERLTGARVSRHFFAALDVVPQVGRLLAPSDDEPGHEQVVVLSDGLWRRRFGADPGVPGRTIRLSGESYEIVGVLPPGVAYPLDTDIWTPLLAHAGGLRDNRKSHLLQVIARVEAHATPTGVDAEVAARGAAIDRDRPDADPGLAIAAVPLLEPIVAPVRRPLVAVLVGAALLMLVLCGNVAHVLLARATAREREMALRSAIGASRWQLARLLVTESIALSLAAGSLGLALAAAAIRVLPQFLPPDLPRMDGLAVDARVVLVALAAGAVTGLAFGVVPALRAGGLATAWRTARGPVVTRRRWYPGTLLGTSQIVLAFVLVTTAAQLARSAWTVQALPLGFDPDHVVRADLTVPPNRLPAGATGDDYAAMLGPLVDRLRTLPGARDAGLTTTAPFGPGASTSFEIVGQPVQGEREPLADIRIVDAGALATLRVPLRAGRMFTRDDSARSAPVMIISEGLAAQYFPGESPLGRRITMLNWGPPLTAAVVGVVGDTAGQDLEQGPQPTIYWHYPQFPQVYFLTLLVRVDGDAAATVRAVRHAIRTLEPETPIARLEPLSVAVSDARARRMLLASVLAGFAAFALAFAVIGVYAILAHRALRRTTAHGVRLALGARPADLVASVAREALAIGFTGSVLGVLASAAAAHWTDPLLFGVSATSPSGFVAALGLVAVAVMAASIAPAIRVARVDPAVVLRAE